MRINNPQMIRSRIRYYAALPKPDKFYDPSDQPGDGISSRLPGAAIGEIERIIKTVHKDTAKEYRRILFGWLFGDENKAPEPMSSKALTPQMWHGLKRWIGVKPVVVEGKTTWAHREEFEEELWWIIAHAKCIFDMCLKCDPPRSIKDGNDWILSQEGMTSYLDYERSGIVSAGIQAGGSVVRPIPWEEPKPVEDTEQTVEMPYVAPGGILTGTIERIGAVVSNVDESEL